MTMLGQHGLLPLFCVCVAVHCEIVPNDGQLNQGKPSSPNITTGTPEPVTTSTKRVTPSISSTATPSSSTPSTPIWTPLPHTPRVCGDSCRFKSTLNITGGYKWTNALLDPYTLEYRELKAQVTCELGKLYSQSDKLALSFNWVEVDQLSPGCINKDFSNEMESPSLVGDCLIVDYYVVFGDEDPYRNSYLTPNGPMVMNAPSDNDRIIPEGFGATKLKEITMELMKEKKLGALTIDPSYNDFRVIEPFRKSAVCEDSCSFAATLKIREGSHKWDNELLDPQTLEYQHLKAQVSFELRKLYTQSYKLGPYFKMVEVKMFGPGCFNKSYCEELDSTPMEGDFVIVHYIIEFGGYPGNTPRYRRLPWGLPRNLKEITRKMVGDDGKLGALTIDPSYNDFSALEPFEKQEDSVNSNKVDKYSDLGRRHGDMVRKKITSITE